VSARMVGEAGSGVEVQGEGNGEGMSGKVGGDEGEGEGLLDSGERVLEVEGEGDEEVEDVRVFGVRVYE
jgi:hypothetical protein